MRTVWRILVVLLLAGAVYFYVAVLPMVSIATGYAAKYVCSCLFVSDIPLEEVKDTDLQFSVVGYVSLDIDTPNKIVKGDLFGFQEQTAVYREGLGCAVVHDIPMNLVKGDYYHPPSSGYVFRWPRISNDTTGLLSNETVAQIETLVASAFEEKDRTKIKNTRAVGVFYKGHLVAEKFAHGSSKDSPLLGWSMSKSVTGTLIGRMEQLGLWDRNATDLLPSWSDERKGISVDNLLSMNSGLEWEEEYDKISDATTMLSLSDAMGQYASRATLESAPGELWEYSSGTSNLLIMAAQKRFSSPREFRDFCYSELFHKLGIRSMIMENDAAGFPVGSSYYWATLGDWAKLGQLYLDYGIWNGERLLSEDWIKYVQAPVEGSDLEYGGSFWLNAGGKLPDVPTSTFSMNGFQGQRMFIIPEKDLIIIRTGVTYNRGDFDFNQFVSSIVESLP